MLNSKKIEEIKNDWNKNNLMMDGMRDCSASLGWKPITNHRGIQKLKVFDWAGNEDKESKPIPSIKRSRPAIQLTSFSFR